MFLYLITFWLCVIALVNYCALDSSYTRTCKKHISLPLCPHIRLTCGADLFISTRLWFESQESEQYVYSDYFLSRLTSCIIPVVERILIGAVSASLNA